MNQIKLLFSELKKKNKLSTEICIIESYTGRK